MPDQEAAPRQSAAVFCVGNKLMLDEGIGCAAYDYINEHYDIPDNVEIFDVGCMSMDMLTYVDKCDLIVTVDAVDDTGEAPGTVFHYEPDAIARRNAFMGSLHELSLIDLFDAAALMGYKCRGVCLGMQVENMSPSEFVIGLTPPCEEALPFLVETVVGVLHNNGFDLVSKSK
ncbi:MAG: hydrogenase maturation protease [Eggerthellaceae bacterium]|nr:hydrogenase maturation protease [Eggerthellaceae bacterium]